MSGGRPPALARWILSAALPTDVRDEIIGDLEETFHRDRAAGGALRAWARFWTKTASFSIRFLIERLAGMFSLLDVKLGLRMLGRYPGLTTVAVLGLSVAIAIGAGAFGILDTFTAATLPLDEGDRIVVLETWDVESKSPERRVMHDLVEWRSSLRSVTDVGAFRQATRNLVRTGKAPETIRVTEMSAAGFRLTRVPALMGRALEERDEHPGAPPVAVVGYDLWRRQLDGDAGVIGRALQLGSSTYTIVGVMPEGFAFPVSDVLWVPLQADAARFERRSGPALTVFARLADGATLESAQAELAAYSQREAASAPAAHEHLRARVLPYTYPFFDLHDASAVWAVRVLQVLFSLLLMLVSVNVAVLVYARTATRHGEIAVRSALGASRRRIVLQLFIEGLLLAGVSAALGLLFTAIGLARINEAVKQVYPQVPFWWTFEISPAVAVYVAGLALLGGAIIGVIPALQATGRRAQADLKQISAGAGGMQLGRTWTFLIVAQVAVAVALLPAVLYHASDAFRRAIAEPPVEASELITMELRMERLSEAPIDQTFLASYAARMAAVEDRFSAEPGVASVTFSANVAGAEPAMIVEVEGTNPPEGSVNYALVEGTGKGHLARFNRVDLDFFATFDIALLAGRSFGPADAHPAAGTIIVNRSFVDEVLGGQSPLGRRLRYVGRSREVRSKVGQVFGNALPRHEQLGHWYEVVGVVEDFPVLPEADRNARLYHAITRGQVYPAAISVRMPGGAPDLFAGHFRQLTAAVDPALQAEDIQTQATILKAEQSTWRIIAAVLGGFMVSVVGLVAAGIYAMMSFTVARRRREIGIRAALGADPRRILRGLFARAAGQLGAGAAIGMVCAVLIDIAGEGEMLQGTGTVVLPIVAAFMVLVGVAAAAGPARRGLRIQPIEALRDA